MQVCSKFRLLQVTGKDTSGTCCCQGQASSSAYSKHQIAKDGATLNMHDGRAVVSTLTVKGEKISDTSKKGATCYSLVLEA